MGPYFGCWGSLLGPYFTKSWVPIGSLFQSLGVPISLGDSGQGSINVFFVPGNSNILPGNMHKSQHFPKELMSGKNALENKCRIRNTDVIVPASLISNNDNLLTFQT